MKTWPWGLLICLLGGLPARFSSASGRGEFIHVTNHRRPLNHLLRSDWSISHHPLWIRTWSLITACWHSPSALQNGLCKKTYVGPYITFGSLSTGLGPQVTLPHGRIGSNKNQWEPWSSYVAILSQLGAIGRNWEASGAIHSLATHHPVDRGMIPHSVGTSRRGNDPTCTTKGSSGECFKNV